MLLTVMPCQDAATSELFFSPNTFDQLEAASMCHGCPLKARCATQGATELYGVWGGLTEADRPAARERRKAELLEDRVETLKDVQAMRKSGYSLSTIGKLLGISKATAGRLAALA